jgi:cell division protein FtsN
LRSDQKAAAVHLGIFPDSGSTAIATATIPPQPPGDRLRSIEELLAGGANPPPAAPPAPAYRSPPVAAPVQQPVRMAVNSATNRSVGQKVSTRRFWVQLACGPNPAALPAEFRRLRTRHASALKGLSPYIAESVDRSRLLIGPFKDREDASIFAEGLESDGVSAFSWTAPEGQMVRKIANE